MTELSYISKLFNDISGFSELYTSSNNAIKVTDSSAKIVTRNLKEFSEQIFLSIDKDIREGLSFSSAKGMIYMPHIVWVAFLPAKSSVSHQISAAICFGKYGEGAVAGLMDSATDKHLRIPTVIRSKNKPLLVDVNGIKAMTRYNDMFVNPKEFLKNDADMNELIKHISDSILLLKKLLN